MKYLVNNQFDDISATITNSGEDIDLDVMNTNQKTSKLTTSIPSQPIPDPSQAIDDKNKEEIGQKKTNDEDLNRNIEQGAANINSICNIPQPRSATPHSQGLSMTSIVGSTISRCKPGVLRDQINSLKEIGIAKNKQKELYDAAV